MIRITEKTRNTKALRLRIYKAALTYIIEHINCDGKFNGGFCKAIYSSLTGDKDGRFDPYNYIGITYEELKDYMPKKIYLGYWFWTDKKGTQKRIKILKKVIKQMEG